MINKGSGTCNCAALADLELKKKKLGSFGFQLLWYLLWYSALIK